MNGLFFRGRGALPFGARIRGVRELLHRLLGGDVSQHADETALAVAA